MKRFILILLVCSAVVLESFTLATDVRSPRNATHEHVSFSRQYFSACGKCSWLSPRSDNYSDASSMGSRHYMAQEGTDHKCSTVSYSPESDDHYIAVCGKCNWSSPEVDSYSDASGMGSKHYLAQEGTDHKCTTIKQ